MENIPAKIISKSMSKDFERFFIELNLRKKKIFSCCSSNPHKSNISIHLNIQGKTLGIQMSKDDIFLTVSNFNSKISGTETRNFCNTSHLHNLVKNSLCCKVKIKCDACNINEHSELIYKNT